MLLLDRSNDCLTPLMHDFTYQPMVRDLLKIEGDQINVEVDGDKGNETKDVLLNDKDKIWVDMRGKHIAQVIEVLSARISETVGSGTGKALGNDKNVSLTELAAALKALPEYREVMAKLSQHMHIAHECMDTFTQNQLMELSELEQMLATGEDDDGEKIDADDLMNMVNDALRRESDSQAKLRLLCIASISQGGLGGYKKKLLRAAKLDDDDTTTLESLEEFNGSSPTTKKKKEKGKGGFFRLVFLFFLNISNRCSLLLFHFQYLTMIETKQLPSRWG